MPPLSVLIKPASGSCNLSCRYCFYKDVSAHRETADYGKMSDATLENLVEKALAHATGFCSFAFQGGEPTLIGLDFYERLITFQKKYNINKVKINNSIQTNGILMDDRWAAFFAAHHFLIGLSLDGDKSTHDLNRKYRNDGGTFNKVMETAKLFDKHGAEYNILCVVTAQLARKINSSYHFFKKHNFKYLQFIPCIDNFEEEGNNPYLLSSEKYRDFLKNLFDLWYADLKKGEYASIREFDNRVNMINGRPPENCAYGGVCGKYYVVEADGGTYPCDFYVLDKWNLGNINDIDFEELHKSTVQKEFIDSSIEHNSKCKACKYYGICRSGCRRDKEGSEGSGLNKYCQAYYEFFEYSYDRLLEVAMYNR